jgi:Zinc finger, C2H2 type
MSFIMSFICGKCSKKFTKKSSLLRHCSKKTPCNEEKNLVCERCRIVFSSKYHLDKHINRKNPCKKIREGIEEKLQLMEAEKDIKIELMEKELEIVEVKKNADLERELQIIEAKTNAKIKLDRERKANILSNIKTQNNITNNTQNNITINFPNPSKEAIFRQKGDDIFRDKLLLVKTIEVDKLLSKLEEEDIKPICVELLSLIHNNKNLPEYNNLRYDKENGCFYGWEKEGWEKLEDPGLHRYISDVIYELIKHIDTSNLLLSEIRNIISLSSRDKHKKLFQEYAVDCLEKNKTKDITILRSNPDLLYKEADFLLLRYFLLRNSL